MIKMKNSRMCFLTKTDHHPKRKIKTSLLLILTLLASFACKETKVKKEPLVSGGTLEETAFSPCCGEPSVDEMPLIIHMAVNDTYCKQTACACIHDIAAREYFDMQQRLKADYNIDLKLHYFMEPYEMEKELKAKTFDGVICKPWTAFMLSEKFKINYKRIADVLDVFNNQWLTGIFLVRKESDIHTLEDIQGKILVAGQVDAYEKYHSPLRLLDAKDIKPNRIYQKASCLECVNELMDKNADVALVSDYVMKASCAVDVVNEEDFRIVGKTERLPLCSVILDMSKVSKADALRLQNALWNVSGEKLKESMLSNGFVKPASWMPKPYLKSIAKY